MTITPPQAWFDEWFDTPYYHLLYKQRDEAEAQHFIDNLVSILQIKVHQKILDVACGKGRHAIYLNQKGFEVVGIDLSGNNITHAQQFESPSLHFVRQDMREVYKPNHFDVVVNLFTSFGYFDEEAENMRTVQAIAAALKPNGLWVLDFFNTAKVIRQLVPYEIKRIQGIEFHIHKKVENQVIVKDIYFKDQDQEFHFQERVKAITHTDFEQYFEAAGLQIRHVFGNYHCHNFDEQHSDRMVFVVQKATN